MKRLLSLPPNLVNYFHTITGNPTSSWFCTSDPLNQKLGSGGGSIWLLESCKNEETKHQNRSDESFESWIKKEKRILIHAGGQSRRLPAYATMGKILTPIPVFRWARGQKLDQTLLTLQMPLYEQIIQKAPTTLNTLIVCGDVYVNTTSPLPTIPQADVVCFGIWADVSLSKNHGVFMINRNQPEKLDYMLQKPSIRTLNELMQTHFSLMDIGIWLLSPKAIRYLRDRSKKQGSYTFYDLYADFGCSLGEHPSKQDPLLNELTVNILPLSQGEFYHFGTSHELISSTTAIQNRIKDQRFIIQKETKPHPTIFTQNAIIDYKLNENNQHIWIENSYLSPNWKLTRENIVTGIPANHWHISLSPGQCVDIVPINEKGYALRPYGYTDNFSGNIDQEMTTFIGQPVKIWLKNHKIPLTWLHSTNDIQNIDLFPVCTDISMIEELLTWMLEEKPSKDLSLVWQKSTRLSANDLITKANLIRLELQRKQFRTQIIPVLSRNYQKSVFYQLDLKQLAQEFVNNHLPAPPCLPSDSPLITRMHNKMLRAEIFQNTPDTIQTVYQEISQLLCEGMTEPIKGKKIIPKLNTFNDQIVWARSSVRIDLAGGWTDTPPYCLTDGGNVVNLAIELNGQPPLQVYVKPCKRPVIVCHSIDQGATEQIETYEQLTNYQQIGSPFSIPKAALALIGFSPTFSSQYYPTLKSQLEDFGAGIEITLLSAIPAGSGLGTSSILAATVLGALSDFCHLGLDKNEIGYLTLILEQLLTTGGGWQDPFGGILHGIKLLQSTSGFNQSPTARWLPENLFRQEEYKACHLLYYTGITRVAKNILSEIVREMFLNENHTLTCLAEMKRHAVEMYDTIQKNDFQRYGELIRTTWEQNKRLDPNTNPPIINSLCHQIDDLCLGYKLPGAGGGGYMYMVAKDPQAALRIKEKLLNNPLSPSSRFIEMSLSKTGLQISRS